MKNFKHAAFLLAVPLVMTCVPVPVPAQTDGQIGAMVTLAGASSEEELDEQEVERYLHFLSHPLEINLAGTSRLLSSGLLSRYQVASLEDYRSRCGDVLSFTELAGVEGFGQEYVSVLKPFISLRSMEPPGKIPEEKNRFSQDVLARIANRGKDFNYGLKYKASFGEMAELSLAGRTTYSDTRQFPPSSWSANAVIYGYRRTWKVVAGDYNLRFGQGLALWSGLSLSGFSSSSSFYRRPTGLSPSCSWSGNGTHRGVAADFQAGRFVFTTFLSLPGLREVCEGKSRSVGVIPGVNAGYYGANGQVSLTAFGGKGNGGLSGDFRLNWKGTDAFGEVAADLAAGHVSGVLGTVIPLGGNWKLSSLVRYYPTGSKSDYSGGVRSWGKSAGERGAAIGLERYGIQGTVDYAMKETDRKQRQLKLFAKVPVQLSPETVVTVRMTGRIRPHEDYLKYRTGARIDLDWSSAGLSAKYGEGDGDAWKGRLRIEGLLFRSLAGLAYVEGGRKTGRYSMYLRGTMFFVDNWDDRICSYERDAPGNFTVPAYYGRGFSVSAVGGSRFRFGDRKTKTLKVFFRVASTRYPFMKEPKPARTEAKLQVMATL
jgi:hypothetical protein